MIVEGIETVNGAYVESHHDHRIAMACAVAALRSNSSVTIADADAINKSFPDFYNQLKKLGAKVNTQQLIESI